jgi:IS30 family transposase
VIWLLVNEQSSPRDISYRIAEELPGERIAYTTIYNFTNSERTDLKAHLRLRGKARRQRVAHRRSRFREGAPPKTNIELRSAWVSERSEFGHYEADTIHSRKNGSGYAILSVRELKSRKRWYSLLADLKAETTLAALQGFFRLLPEHMRRTLTVDNGPENEHLSKLEKVFPGFKVYFCDPYCAWQRGAIENANGEFRWYYPKGTDFQDVPVEEIWKVQDKLNRRRMRCLGGKSSETVFEQARKHPPLIHVVSAEVLHSEAALRREAGLHPLQSSNLFLPSPAQWD